MSALRPLLALVAASLTGIACAGSPEPPDPIPEPTPPRVEPAPIPDDLIPELPGIWAQAPRLRWSPLSPSEGNFAILLLEPEGRSLPILEVAGRASDRALEFAPLSGGAYIGMVAAPLGAETVPVDIEVTFLDGTRLSQILTLLVMATDFPATRLRVASRYTSPDSATQERAAYERAAVQAMRTTVTPTPLWDGPFELPLSGITTSPFGQRRLFNNELRSRHTGLDIDGDTGDPVYAANSGRVAMSADLFYNGGAVFIDHGLGLYTGYFHLSKREVDLGQHVKKGQIIGRVGATGRVTGPHLHWHMYLQGFSLDPRSLLDPDFAQIVRALSRTALDAPEP